MYAPAPAGAPIYAPAQPPRPTQQQMYSAPSAAHLLAPRPGHPYPRPGAPPYYAPPPGAVPNYYYNPQMMAMMGGQPPPAPGAQPPADGLDPRTLSNEALQAKLAELDAAVQAHPNLAGVLALTIHLHAAERDRRATGKSVAHGDER